MAVLTTTSKKEGFTLSHPSNIVTFEAGDHLINSYAELTTFNLGSLSTTSTSSRRITRTTKTPSHPQFGDAVLMYVDDSKFNFHNVNTNNILAFNNFRSEDYIYILCCIRI